MQKRREEFADMRKNIYLCTYISPLQSIMETSDHSIELQIAEVLNDIRQKGYSSVQPFSIGKVEERMMRFAQANAVTLASDDECFIYTDGTSKFIVHPNYKMKICRELVVQVNFITATRIKDPAEFTLPKYRKI